MASIFRLYSICVIRTRKLPRREFGTCSLIEVEGRRGRERTYQRLERTHLWRTHFDGMNEDKILPAVNVVPQT